MDEWNSSGKGVFSLEPGVLKFLLDILGAN
jgi:hypothetical protein